MHFTFSLLATLLGIGTTASATCFITAGPASYKACCPTPQSSGKGTISGVVFKYTCGQYFNSVDPTISASSAKECAEECQKNPRCNSASWSTKQRCSLLEEKYPIPNTPSSTWLTLQKTTEEPDPEQDCKELLEAARLEAESKCTTETHRLQRDGESQCRTEKDTALTDANAQCRKDKDAALANADSQCAAELDKLRAEADANALQAQSQCTSEKDQLRQQADTARMQCQNEKDTALTNSNSQCTSEKDQLRQQLADAARMQCQSEKDTVLTNSNSQCTIEKDQLRQQADTARTQCQSEKDTALTNFNSQCTIEKDQLRQQLADATRQRDMERDGLQKQLKDAQDKVRARDAEFTDSASAQDTACINNSWNNLCSGNCRHDTFTVGGVEFKRKCNVSTGGGREEQWLNRSSVMDCVRECAGIKACLGIGWIGLQGPGGHCHAHMTISGNLQTAPSRGNPLHEHHLIYVPTRASVR